jgi:hypothetical protein
MHRGAARGSGFVNGARFNRGAFNNNRSLSGTMARNNVGVAGNSINRNLSLNGANGGVGYGGFGSPRIGNFGSSYFGSNYGNSGYGNGYGYGNGGYGYGNGLSGYGGYGYRNSNLVRVYWPGVGWVLVPIRAIRAY